MAPLQESSTLKNVILPYLLLLVFFTASILLFSPKSIQVEPQKYEFFGRKLLELDNEEAKPIKKKSSTSSSALFSTKNQTKLAKTTNIGSSKNTTASYSSKNQAKIAKLPSESLKNKTKLLKPTSDSTSNEKPTIKSQLNKLNSTSKSSDLLSKSSTPKNKTTIPTTSTKEPISQLDKYSKSTSKDQTSEQKPKSEKAKNQQKTPSLMDQEEDEEYDLVTGFTELPAKFQETLLPDLERISKTSQVYLNNYNKKITKGFKPYVGNKYAPTIASIISFAFLLIPLLLVSLIFNRIKAYFSLQKILIFIQVYLSIYFSILCLYSLVTGLEPLRFFYATSQSTYVCLQVIQALAYILYLLLLMMYLILVFSTETGLVTKLLGLGQTFVGFAVGLHYYMNVFHMAVLRQQPKTSWRAHAVYATFFLVICLLTRADRRKKAYLGGEEGKLS